MALNLPSLIVVKHKIYFEISCVDLCGAQRDTDNLLSASDYTNFAFNFVLTITCKLKTIVLIFL